jgi:hypothetical protein
MNQIRLNNYRKECQKGIPSFREVEISYGKYMKRTCDKRKKKSEDRLIDRSIDVMRRIARLL